MGFLTLFKYLSLKHKILKKIFLLDTKHSLAVAPTVYHDESGTMIIIASEEGEIIALDKELKQIWKYKVKDTTSNEDKFFYDETTSMSIHSSPIVTDINDDSNPEIIFGTEHGLLYALDKKGKELWKFKTNGPIRTSAIVADINDDGKKEIIFGSSDQTLYILNYQGKLLNSFTAESAIESSPEILIRKTGKCIVFGSDKGFLYCVSSAAKEIWKFDAGSKILIQPSVGDLYSEKRNHILFGTEKGEVYCINDHGTLSWSYKTNGAILSNIVIEDINKDGKFEVLFGSADDAVYALTAHGIELWKFHTHSWIGSSPIVTDFNNDGNFEVIIGSCDGNLYMLDAYGSLELDYLPGLSGIVNQSGTYSDTMMQDIGRYEGKEIDSIPIEGGMITGTGYIPEQNRIVVATKKGVVSEVGYAK